jgi:hypothetical protein
MPYAIVTKDGIEIKNIPDDIAPDADVLKARVAEERVKLAGAENVPPLVADTLPDASLGMPVFDEAGLRVTESEMQPAPQQASQDISLGGGIVGAGETALTLATGATGGLTGQILGTLKGLSEQIVKGKYGTQEGATAVQQEASRLAQLLTYEPKTDAGKQFVGAIGEAGEFIAPVTDALAPLAGTLQLAGQGARAALPMTKGLIPQKGLAQAQRVEPTVEGMQSSAPITAAPNVATIGPAGDLPNAGAAGVLPENMRIEAAEGLPVPVKLTKGAASRDADQLSFEKEQIKTEVLGAPLRKRAEENNLQALQNFDSLIDMTEATSPDIAATGNRVIKALSEGYKAAKTKTRVAYTKARKSQEAQEIVDVTKSVIIGEGDSAIEGTLLSYIESKVEGVPSAAVTDKAKKLAVKMGIATENEDGSLTGQKVTVGQLEDYRKELSGTADMTNPSQIRDETILKKIIDAQTESTNGELYKDARLMRTQQARKFENRAIVARLITNVKGMDDPKVAADAVFRKTILNSSPEEIRFLSRVLKTVGGDGAQAWKELQGATMRHIRDESTKGMGMDSSDNPLVSPAKLHGAVNQLDRNGRLDLMLGKKNAATVRNLNDVVKYVTTVPPGTLVNSSGTSGVILAAMSEMGLAGVTTGIPLPVLTGLKVLRDTVKSKKIKGKISEALQNLEPKGK